VGLYTNDVLFYILKKKRLKWDVLQYKLCQIQINGFVFILWFVAFFFRISSTTHGLLVHVTFVLLVWLRKKKKKHKSLQNVQQETVVHLLSLTCCNSLNILIHFCFRTNEVEATVVCLVMLWNKWKGVLNFLNVFFGKLMWFIINL